jgi:hypothetical protein
MPGETPAHPPVPPAPPPRPATPAESGVPTIGEEFDSAQRTLPPAKILLLAAAGVALIIALVALVQKPHPPGNGSIDNIAAVEVTGQNSVLVAINVTLSNQEEKPLYIHTLQAKLQTASGDFSDEAASPVDFERYFQAFPALQRAAIDPLKVETKIAPGAMVRGTIVVSFPVNQAAFEGRKSLSVVIQPYDMRAVVITK